MPQYSSVYCYQVYIGLRLAIYTTLLKRPNNTHSVYDESISLSCSRAYMRGETGTVDFVFKVKS